MNKYLHSKSQNILLCFEPFEKKTDDEIIGGLFTRVVNNHMEQVFMRTEAKDECIMSKWENNKGFIIVNEAFVAEFILKFNLEMIKSTNKIGYFFKEIKFLGLPQKCRDEIILKMNDNFYKGIMNKPNLPTPVQKYHFEELVKQMEDALEYEPFEVA